MKLLAIVQARMGSSRLPGKIMLSLDHMTVIEMVLARLAKVLDVDKIVVATTANKEDDELTLFLESKGVCVFRGSEKDVLDRFYQCALKEHAQSIMRITADCPLLAPDICQSLYELYRIKQADYAHLSSDYAEGVDCEIISFHALDTAWQNAKLYSEREHVTQYFFNCPNQFNIAVLKNKANEQTYRFTLDNHEDYLVIKKIIEKSVSDALDLSYAEIKKILDDNPQIKEINSTIIRNEGLIISKEMDKKINDDS